ncbi:coiled-coil domain-containing protein 97 isoform X1 [Stegastes partitus]|uniref:Coiled-coil domain containing 97 n=1 Tax=Stegastes partitus TaxID=144197 RepID=A0A3B5AUM6_9TELE|nr:PREDICTED: coiled-coil domain-containing protein 97 isoform X1 [Stegastes partitus]XP_008304121.1 PREDICTED: coiled-coil domain-containing protein 97 isoform X1 [Stegastes partitus]XP_008304122.1 PREDICTED: coiled-coil domain-containing protein 97 isoform X1 [Stegastes partitus]
MWGEIDPPVKSPPSPRESKDKSKLPEAPEVQSQKWEFDRPRETQQPLQDFQCVSRAESICVNAMIEAVAMSGSLVKSQQMGEAELTVNERKEELLYQYRSRPLVFLERYHACLKPQHLSAFAHVSSDPRTQHYSKVIQRRATGHTNRTRVRNKRYAALRALQKEGQYFSEEEMRMREPLLYEQYIGQYLTDEEVLERSQEAMSDGAQGAPGAQGGSTGGLAHLLLNSYQERLIQNRLQEEQEREEGALEEDEDDEDDDTGVQQKGWEPTPKEKTLLREEFISQMHQRFLDGKDKDFNYSEVDENPDYDNLDIVSRDAEDKYFDDDDDDDEEEEEDEVEHDAKEENMTE